MENYLAVVKVKGAKTACKASFSCSGVAAAIIKMCELVQTPIGDIAEYDLMEMTGANTMRVVASRTGKDNVLPFKPEELQLKYTESTYTSYIKEAI